MQYTHTSRPLVISKMTREPLPQDKIGMKFHFHMVGDEIGWVLEDGTFIPESDQSLVRYTKNGTYIPVEDKDYYGERQWLIIRDYLTPAVTRHFSWKDGKYWWFYENGELSQKDPSCFTHYTINNIGPELPRSQFCGQKPKKEEIKMYTISCKATPDDIGWLRNFAIRKGLKCYWEDLTSFKGMDHFIIYSDDSINVNVGGGGKSVSLAEVVKRIEEYVKPVPPIKVGEWEVKFHTNGDIQIGCQALSFAKVEEVYLAAKAKKEGN